MSARADVPACLNGDEPTGAIRRDTISAMTRIALLLVKTLTLGAHDRQWSWVWVCA